MVNQNEETWPQILRNVWNIPATALRVVPRVNTGSGYADLAGDGSGNLNVNVVSGSIALTGADGAMLDGVNPTIRATVFDYANSNPQAVQLVDSNGDPASVGGGTQYDEGVADTTITGTAAMWEDAADTLRPISMAKPLPVQPGTSVLFNVTLGGKVLIEGTQIDGVDLSVTSVNPVLVGGRAVGDNHLHAASLFHTAAGLRPWLTLLVDAGDHGLDIKSSGEIYGLVGSTDDTKTNAHYIKTTSDGTLVFPNVTLGAPTEATFGTADLQGINLTSSSAWTLALATPSNPWRLIEVLNTTDVPIQISYDGTNRRMTYAAGTGAAHDYYPLGLKVSAAVSVRNDGTAPSRGRVYVHGETV